MKIIMANILIHYIILIMRVKKIANFTALITFTIIGLFMFVSGIICFNLDNCFLTQMSDKLFIIIGCFILFFIMMSLFIKAYDYFNKHDNVDSIV